jgi:hypothetical protein
MKSGFSAGWAAEIQHQPATMEMEVEGRESKVERKSVPAFHSRLSTLDKI